MKEVCLRFGTLRLVENHVISEINSGVDFDRKCADEFISVIRDHFGNESFGYISHRINDYNINPAEARRMIYETNLIVAAFVLKRRLSIQAFETESIFYNIPKKVFNDLESAEIWVEQKLVNTDA